MAVHRFKGHVCKTVHYYDIPNRPNGGKWIALGFHDDSFFDINKNVPWKEYVPFDGPVHKTGKEFAQGFYHTWSGLDSNVFFEIPDGVFELGRNIIKGKLSAEALNDEQQYLFSIALQKKLFIRNEYGFKQNYYFIGSSARKQLEAIANEFYAVAYPCFEKAWQQILDEYQKTIPKHLCWQMGNFLSNHLNHFVTCSLYEGVQNNKLSKPDEENKEWLSLFTSEV